MTAALKLGEKRVERYVGQVDSEGRHDLDRASTVGQAPDQAAFFEADDQAMDARLRGEPQFVLHLNEAGRDAIVARYVAVDELEQAALLFGEAYHAASDEPVFTTGVTIRDKSSGSSLPATFAAKRKWAIRDFGIPIVRQLWTVERGASIIFATAEVPPR